MSEYWPAAHCSPLASYSPVIHRLMRTNEPPLAEEVYQAYTIFREAPQHLSQLDEEIRRSEDVLAELRRKRCDLALFLKDEQRIISHMLSPLRRVPAEIISEIALHALNRYTERPIHVSLAPHKLGGGRAWTLAQVCRSWRNNFLSFSELWSLVEIKLPAPNSAPIMAELLRRSGTSPLHLHFKLHPGAANNVTETLDMCLEHANRWKQLKIEHYGRSHQDLAKFNTVRGSLPCLQSLSLDIYCNDSADDRLTSLDAFECAPRLREVRLKVNSSAAEVLQIPLPWQRLEYYRNIGPRANPSSNPLPTLSNLIDCCLHGDAGSFHIPASRVRFPLLQSLEVTSLDVLEHLLVPALERLQIRSIPADVTPVVELITRSACNLQSLAIRQKRISASFLQLLRVAPTLTSLDFTSQRPTTFNQLSSSLSVSHDRPPQDTLLPNLRRITLVVYVVAEQDFKLEDADALIRMVESRSHIPIPGSESADDFVVSCLRQIRVDLSWIHERGLASMQALRARFEDLRDRLDVVSNSHTTLDLYIGIERRTS